MVRPILIFLLLSQLTSVAATITSVDNGSWNDPLIWDSGTIPTGNDEIIIQHRVSLAGTFTINASGKLQIVESGSLFIETLSNNGGVMENMGLFMSLSITNYGNFSNTGSVEAQNLTNKVSATLYNAGIISVASNLTNENTATIDNIKFIIVEGMLSNSGTLNSAAGSGTLIDGDFTNEPSGLINLCGAIGFDGRSGAVSNKQKTFINNGTIAGCNGGVAGDANTTIVNNGTIIPTASMCLASNDFTNNGVGTFQLSCCFIFSADAGFDRSLCLGNSTVLGGNPTGDNGIPPFTYTWVVQGDESNVISTEPNPEVSPTSSTAYIVTVFDSSTPIACEVSDTVKIMVTDQVIARAGPDKIICEGEIATLGAAQTASCGQGPYSIVWSPATGLDDPTSANPNASPSSTTLYEVSVTDDLGNVSTAQTVVFVQPRPPAANAGPDQALCRMTTTSLDANAVITGSGFWEVTAGTATFADSSDPKTLVSNLSEGDNILKWVNVSESCTSSDEVLIFVDASPVADAGPDQLGLCDDTSVIMQANSPNNGGGSWAVIAGTATIVDESNPLTDVNGFIKDGSIITLQWTVTGDVCATTRDEMSLSVEDSPPEVTVGDDQQLCNQTATTIAANVATTSNGQWNKVSGSGTIVNPMDVSTEVTGLVPGGVSIFSYSISTVNCGVKEAQIKVEVFAEPDNADAGADQILCNNETLTTLGATPPNIGIGRWEIISGSGALSDPTSATSQITDLTPGITELRWVVSNGTCDDKLDNVILTIFPPTAVANNLVTLCRGNETQLLASGGDAYNWSPATGLSAVDIPNPIASPQADIVYSVDIIRNGCTTEVLSVTVDVVDVPVISVTPTDTTITVGSGVQLEASGAITYQWTPTTGLSNSNVPDPVASPLSTTTYSVEGFNSDGCSAKAEVLVSIDDDFQIFVPQMFTPNGDGRNDLLLLNTIGIKSAKFQVFNRFGELMFTTTGNDSGWNGTFNGQDQNSDTYAYVVVAETYSGQKITKKGSVQLIR